MSKDPDLTNVGDRIRYLRKSKSWTQKQLAEQVGCAQEYVSEIENKKKLPTMEMLSRFARAFEVKLSTLFGGADEAALHMAHKLALIATFADPSEQENDDADAERQFSKHASDEEIVVLMASLFNSIYARSPETLICILTKIISEADARRLVDALSQGPTVPSTSADEVKAEVTRTSKRK